MRDVVAGSVRFFAGCLALLLPLVASAANPMLHATNGALADGRGGAVQLHCVNLSPWLVPEGYLIGEGSLAALATSPSQIKQRLVDLVGVQ